MNTPVAMITGDFRSSGKTDLAVLDQADGLVSILLGNGDGTFANKIDTSVGRNPTALVTGDFNADGRPDPAVTNGGAGTTFLSARNRDETLTPQTVTPPVVHPPA